MLHDFDYVDVSTLPEHMQGAVRRYLNNGIMPGDFLTALLENDLVHSFGLADETNLTAMRTWVEWLYMECPGGAWGSEDNIRKWCDARRERAAAQVDEPTAQESRLAALEERVETPDWRERR